MSLRGKSGSVNSAFTHYMKAKTFRAAVGVTGFAVVLVLLHRRRFAAVGDGLLRLNFGFRFRLAFGF